MKEIEVFTKDKVKIAVNHYQQGFEEVVIVMPGWCMTKDSNAFKQIAEFFAQKYDVLSMDFRGHGKSKGLYTFSAKEVNDVKAVIEYAHKQGYKKIYLAGFSLGGAIAVIYASQNNNADKVIAVSTPCEFSKIENKMWKKEAWGETFKKFELGRFLSIRPNIIPIKKIKPIGVVQNIKAPTLFIAGKKDPTVCFWHTKELYKKARCKKEFKLFENGIHAEDLYLHFKEEFSSLCLNWLEND